MRHILIFLCLCLTACAPDSVPTSSLQDIAEPGTPGFHNYLVWYDTGYVVLGKCEQAIARADCQTILARKDYREIAQVVTHAIQADLTSQTAAREVEVINLRNAHPVIVSLRQDISKINEEMKALSLAVEKIAADIQAAKTDIAKVLIELEDNQLQLNEVDRRLLLSPHDLELKRLRKVLVNERSTLFARHQNDQQVIEDGEIDLQEGRMAMRNKIALQRAKQAELEQQMQTLPVTSLLLTELNAQVKDLQSQQMRQTAIFGKLRDGGLVYRTSIMNKTDHTVVRRIFAALVGKSVLDEE